MASDEAVREGSSARSVRWPAYRQAAEHLSPEHEQSDGVNVSGATPHHVSPPPPVPHHRRPLAVPVPEPFNLWIPKPCAYSPLERLPPLLLLLHTCYPFLLLLL